MGIVEVAMRDHLLRLIIVCGVYLGAVTPVVVQASTWANAARVGAAYCSDTAQLVGIRFKDEDVSTALDMLEAGDGVGAADLLTRVLTDKNAARNVERDQELKAALGLVYARTGQRQKATASLSGVASASQKTSIVRRAEVMKMAVIASHKEGTAGSKDLWPREDWLETLRGVRRDLELKLQKEQDLLMEKAKVEKFVEIKPVLAATATIIDQVMVIEVDRDASVAVVKDHSRALTDTIGRILSQIATIRGRVSELERKRAGITGPKSQGARDQVSRSIEREQTRIREANEAVQQLQREQSRLNRIVK
ncbi:MAG: hypothetical protein KF745_11060 [Phycisphaeraceae bacterium]|nr:hypothetical protein [Phycisphaeraceae bacterium]